MYTIKLDGGKYTVINDNGTLTFLRNGGAWGGGVSYDYSDLILAMAERIETLETAAAKKPSASAEQHLECLDALHTHTDQAIAAAQDGDLAAKNLAWRRFSSVERHLRESLGGAVPE